MHSAGRLKEMATEVTEDLRCGGGCGNEAEVGVDGSKPICIGTKPGLLPLIAKYASLLSA